MSVCPSQCPGRNIYTQLENFSPKGLAFLSMEQRYDCTLLRIRPKRQALCAIRVPVRRVSLGCCPLSVPEIKRTRSRPVCIHVCWNKISFTIQIIPRLPRKFNHRGASRSCAPSGSNKVPPSNGTALHTAISMCTTKRYPQTLNKVLKACIGRHVRVGRLRQIEEATIEGQHYWCIKQGGKLKIN